MKILVSRSMIMRSWKLMVPFILPYDLCKITFVAISQFLRGKNVAKI